MIKPKLAYLSKLNIDKTVATLFMLVLTSAFLLITINFYSFKITSAVRAYINGESEYSKGQKDALVFLLSYINLEDENDWQHFKQEISVPIADNNARNAMYAHVADDTVAQYFLAGRNHPNDLLDMVWLFKNFQHVSFFQKPVAIWQQAEPLINRLDFLGTEIHNRQQKSPLTSIEKKGFLLELNILSVNLSELERKFSSLLGNAARRIRFYLFILNIFFIVIIITSIIIYVNKMIKRLAGYTQRLAAKNEELTTANKELDVFIFSASHDLRSPIASVKGLVDVALQEEGSPALQQYLRLMRGMLDKQDDYIKTIINFFKSKRGPLQIELVDIKLVAEEIFELNRFSPTGKDIELVTDIAIGTFYSDALRVRTILNNLISNAIKYSNKKVSNKQILVKAYSKNGSNIIVVEDNGIGIHKKHHSAIFELFFVQDKNEKSTGIGLYIVKQSVDMLGGIISLESELDKGTKFTITLPALGLV